jgi:hypothetical protein
MRIILAQISFHSVLTGIEFLPFHMAFVTERAIRLGIFT